MTPFANWLFWCFGVEDALTRGDNQGREIKNEKY